MNTVGVTDYTNLAPLRSYGEDPLAKATQVKNTSFILLLKLFWKSEKWILIGLNPHAKDLNFLMPFPAYKLGLFRT